MDDTGAYYTEWSKPERKTPIQCVNAYIWNLERWQRWPYMQDSKRDTDVKNRLLNSVGEWRVGWFERIALKYVYYHMWNRLLVQVWCMRQDAQGWCTAMTLRDGMGTEMGGDSGWGTHIHPWLIHVNVWQKPLQYFKLISLQWKLI